MFFFLRRNTHKLSCLIYKLRGLLRELALIKKENMRIPAEGSYSTDPLLKLKSAFLYLYLFLFFTVLYCNQQKLGVHTLIKLINAQTLKNRSNLREFGKKVMLFPLFSKVHSPSHELCVPVKIT